MKTTIKLGVCTLFATLLALQGCVVGRGHDQGRGADRDRDRNTGQQHDTRDRDHR